MEKALVYLNENQPGEVRPSSPGGRLTLELDLQAIPQPTGFVSAIAGETWNFQLWHRDFVAGPGTNFTEAISVLMR